MMATARPYQPATDHSPHLSFALDQPQAGGTAAHEPLSAAYWTGLLRLAERATLDFVTFPDSFAPPAETASAAAARPDAVAVAARVAPLSGGVGLVPTVTTTHTEPFHTQAALATLDFVSLGRAGWLVDVSTTAAQARAFGRKPAAAPAELWGEAADAVEVASRLWDSWEDDAEIRDAATGRFVDRDRLHYVDFEGPRFSVRGPSIVPRPPQGAPPVVVRLDAEDLPERQALATEHADVVLLSAEDPGAARRAGEELRARAERAGRAPATPRILAVFALDFGAGVGTAARPGGAPPRFTGPPAAFAQTAAGWLADGAVDGFHLLPRVVKEDLRHVSEELVPALRAEGLFRERYAGRTLRDHLGLRRPANRYAPKVTS